MRNCGAGWVGFTLALGGIITLILDASVLGDWGINRDWQSVCVCAPSLQPRLEGKTAGPLGPTKRQGQGPSSCSPSVPICHAASVLMKTVHVWLLTPNYPLRPGWLTYLFCGCQTCGESSFIKNQTLSS